METKSINSKMEQKERAKQLSCSSSTLQLSRNDIKMHSPYKPNNPENSSKTSNDLKRPQMSSKDENDKAVSKKVKIKKIKRW